MNGWFLALLLLVFGDHPDTHAGYVAWVAKADRAYAAIVATSEIARAAEPVLQSLPKDAGLGPALARGAAAAERLLSQSATAYRAALPGRPEQPDQAAIGPLLAKGAAHIAQSVAGGLAHYRAAICDIPPRRAPPRDPALASLISEASSSFDLPEPWIRAIVQVESNGDPDATSPKGAMGLMQVMPATYASLSDRYGLGDDPYALRDNIRAGSAYLRELYGHYGAAGFLAAYNAGPGRYEDSFCRGCSLPEETKRYVAAVRLALGDLVFEHPHSRFYQPIAIAPNGSFTLGRTGAPMPVTERLALHSLIERASQRARSGQ